MESEVIEILKRKVQAVKAPDRVLIFLLSGLGDTLMFSPALRHLRLAWPRTRMVALTMRPAEYDVLHTNKDLDEVLMWPFLEKKLGENLGLIRRLRAEAFDLSILPCPTNRIHYNILSRLCGAPRRAGFRYLSDHHRNLGFLNTFLIPHQNDIHNAEHNLLLAERLSHTERRTGQGMKKPSYVLQTLDSDSHEAEKILQRRELEGRLLIGMHVSSSRAKHMERKCWARENFLSVARELHGKHSDLAILLFCGEEDRAESEWLRAQEPHLFHLIQGVPVRVVAELLKRCKLMLSNDSGLMHLASAVQTPLVALFGPTNPLRTGPWEHATASVVRTGHPCSPCFYHTSRDLTCPEAINFACLREITPEIVIASVEDMLQRCSRTNLSE